MAGSGAPPIHVGHALPVLEDAVLLRADVWRYIGEGAANIVVAYEGDVAHYVRF